MRDEHVTLLGTLVPKVLPNPVACQNFMDGVQNGAWARLFPVSPGVSFSDGVMVVVRTIAAEGWVRVLLEKLEEAFPARGEFRVLLGHCDVTIQFEDFVPDVIRTRIERIAIDLGGRAV